MRSVFNFERLAIAVATQMSLRPLLARSNVLKPASSVMNREAPRLYIQGAEARHQIIRHVHWLVRNI